MVQFPSLSAVTHPSNMISSGFVDLSPEQLPPTPLPLEHTVKDVHAVGPTRDQGKQNFGTSDAQFIINLVSLFGV